MTSERKRLVKQLDALCRKILLIRDQYSNNTFQCISCRRLLPLNCAQVGHYLSRRYEAVRWDLRNINLQCVWCNKWQSGNQIEYRKSLLEKYGEEIIEKIERDYRISPGYSVFDLSQMVKEYQRIFKQFKEVMD